jgi:hypothetical protein
MYHVFLKLVHAYLLYDPKFFIKGLIEEPYWVLKA